MPRTLRPPPIPTLAAALQLAGTALAGPLLAATMLTASVAAGEALAQSMGPAGMPARPPARRSALNFPGHHHHTTGARPAKVAPFCF